ncbi:unnamed protein product [Adineta ricciae]|uniref:Uncharacterized protein n=1 Tax=Adineta ricciae TaxID=249248 RepID=A0A814PVB1_ADIRI|nr:unnamed protein product [Adineta ricciae]CAF1110920.1 unnamed protein product [Adineta ricciae]
MLFGTLNEDSPMLTLHKIEIQSASEDEMNIMIVGLKSNVKLFRKKVKLFMQRSTLVQLDWNNIDLVTFESINDDEQKRFHFILISIEIT